MIQIIITIVSLLSFSAFANPYNGNPNRAPSQGSQPPSPPSGPLPGPIPPHPWPDPYPDPTPWPDLGDSTSIEYVSCGHDFLDMGYCPVGENIANISVYRVDDGICSRDINWGVADDKIWVKGCSGIFAVKRW